MERVRIGVIGVGHLGRHHARLLAENSLADLVGVADTREEVAREIATLYGVAAFTDYRELAAGTDALCVVVPTQLHREVAGYCLEQGRDVLVEKPITPTVEEGRELVALARERELILQVGHLERFGPVMREIRELGIKPKYIEAHRLSPFTFRSTDIGVVLDLMIHDVDLVLAMIDSPVKSVDAFGGAVFTPAEDMASAIIKFENGSVAHLTANRIALKPLRRMRMFSPQGYVSIDFNEAKAVLIKKNEGWDLRALEVGKVDPSKIDNLWKFVFEGLLTVKEYVLDENNPLQEELTSFLRAVLDRSEPVVPGEAGCEAVAVAHRVLAAIASNPWVD